MADPISIIGAIAAYAEIVKIIVRISKNVASLRSRWSEGARSLQLLVQKLSAVRAVLTEIEDWKNFSLESSPVGKSLSDGFDVAIDSCKTVMDALDREIVSLTGDSVASRLRQFFLDQSLKEYDIRLQSQISVLQLLLTAAYRQDVMEQNALLREQSSQLLLQRVQDDATTIREQSTVRETASEQLEPLELQDDDELAENRDRQEEIQSEMAPPPQVEDSNTTPSSI
jgi:hypothetical protein